MDNLFERIYSSALKFLVPLDVQETYMIVSKEAINLVGGGYASIFLYEGDKLRRIYTTHPELATIEPRKRGLTYEVYNTGVARLRHNDDLVKANSKFKELPFDSNISLPLTYGHITLGVLSILSQKGKKFTKDDLDILTLYAPLATLVVRKAYLSEELNRALEVRDLFMSLAAHELKTPLTIISAYNDSLLKTISDTKQKKYALKIKNASERMKNLINEFLQVDLNNQGKLHYKFRMIEVGSLIKKAVDNFIKINTNYKFIFKPPTKRVFVKIDPEKIIEVIYNFLNNAVKFSPEGSEIIINLEFVKGELLLSVTDKGEGIAKENLKNIFGKFEKGNSKKSGMGLGLYLSKEIIEDHKGTIDIDSEVGKGTTISFILPIIKK